MYGPNDSLQLMQRLRHGRMYGQKDSLQLLQRLRHGRFKLVQVPHGVLQPGIQVRDLEEGCRGWMGCTPRAYAFG